MACPACLSRYNIFADQLTLRNVVLSEVTLAPHASAGENLYNYLRDPSLHLHSNTPALASGVRERSAVQCRSGNHDYVRKVSD
jgi:hypothetical protein